MTTDQFISILAEQLSNNNSPLLQMFFVCWLTSFATLAQSRVVEAICIRLTDVITQPRVNAPGGYASRWKLVLSAYNQIRGRLHHCQLLSEQTDLALHSLNETTLTKWLVKCIYLRTTIEVALFFHVFIWLAKYHDRYKNNTRREEIKTLIQGKSLPVQYPLARGTLPANRDLPTAAPAEPRTPEEIPDKDDTVGQAKVGRAVKPAETSSYSSQSKPVSRKTEWQQQKRVYDQSAREEPASSEKAPCKEYSCRVCNQAMVGTGHTQFQGKRYCPNALGQIPKEEWLALRKSEAETKKDAPRHNP